jgi:hypothetical protein
LKFLLVLAREEILKTSIILLSASWPELGKIAIIETAEAAVGADQVPGPTPIVNGGIDP